MKSKSFQIKAREVCAREVWVCSRLYEIIFQIDDEGKKGKNFGHFSFLLIRITIRPAFFSFWKAPLSLNKIEYLPA